LGPGSAEQHFVLHRVRDTRVVAVRIESPPMIDHISVAVRDLERAARFYEAALARSA
jgi:hypothetical protein